MKKEIDRKHDIAYIQLRRGSVHKTKEILPGILVDLDKKGRALGIEIISVSESSPHLKTSKSKKVA